MLPSQVVGHFLVSQQINPAALLFSGSAAGVVANFLVMIFLQEQGRQRSCAAAAANIKAFHVALVEC